MSDNSPSKSASKGTPANVPTRYPYAVLGGLVLAAMATIVALAVLGVSGPGFFSFTLAAAFWAMGSALLVLTGASIFLYFTLRSTSRVLAKHEADLVAVREGILNSRIQSLEGSHKGARAGAAVHEGRLTSLENSRQGSSAGAVARDGRLASLEDGRTGATMTSAGMQEEIARLESRIASLEKPRSAADAARAAE